MKILEALAAPIPAGYGDRWWNRIIQITFGLFVGGLVALLIMLYAGMPIV